MVAKNMGIAIINAVSPNIINVDKHIWTRVLPLKFSICHIYFSKKYLIPCLPQSAYIVSSMYTRVI
jgi:hypothetical protein